MNPSCSLLTGHSGHLAYASLQYSCLENPMDEGAWKAAVHGVTEGQTQLSDFTFPSLYFFIQNLMTLKKPPMKQTHRSLTFLCVCCAVASVMCNSFQPHGL